MTKFFQVRKDIPLPARKYISRYAKTLREMEVGDSFVVPYNRNKTRRRQLLNLNSSAAYVAEMEKKKFSLRCTESGIGIWRTE